jgi:hypothetical protein
MLAPVDIRSSVRFDQAVDQGQGPNVAYPFIYTLVSKSSDVWDTTKSVNAIGNMNTGPGIAPGQTARAIVILDNDYPYLLLRIAYVMRKFVQNITFPNAYFFCEETRETYRDTWDYQTAYGEDLLQYVWINCSFTTDQTFLYGTPSYGIGQTLAMPAALNNMVPIGPKGVQGYEYKPNSIRTRKLLPAGGGMVFEFYNSHATATLIPEVMIYGMKVRI